MKDILLFLTLNLMLFNVNNGSNHEADPFSINKTQLIKSESYIKNRLTHHAENLQLSQQYSNLSNQAENFTFLTHEAQQAQQPQSILFRKPRTTVSTIADPFYLATRIENQADFNGLGQTQTNYTEMDPNSNKQDDNSHYIDITTRNDDDDFDHLNNDTIQALTRTDMDTSDDDLKFWCRKDIRVSVVLMFICLIGLITIAFVLLYGNP